MKTNSKIKRCKNRSIIEERLRRIPFTKLSKDSEFCKRKPKKIKPKEFLIAFFMMVLGSGNNSYNNWAAKIGLLTKKTISKQALWKRMNVRQILFLQKVLNETIKDKMKNRLSLETSGKLNQFKRVIIEDSTTIKLNDKLWKEYPGSSNQNKSKQAILKIQVAYNLLRGSFLRFDLRSYRKLNDKLWKEYPGSSNQNKSKQAILKIQVAYNLLRGSFLRFDLRSYRKLNDKLWKEYPGSSNQNKSKQAILKIQVAYNLLRGSFLRFDLRSYRNNDLSYSGKILELCNKGDLIIRDLGYFVMEIFKRITEQGANFVSRMKANVLVYSKEEDEKPIDLAKMLRKRGQLDIDVFIGEKNRLPVRLIAIPIEASIAAERKRKAIAEADKRWILSKKNLYLLGWELFITNVKKDNLEAKDIAAVYFIRWRIEIIFKCWKSYLKITNVPNDVNKIRIESYIYCMLIFIMLFQVSFYNYCLDKYSISNRKFKNKWISMMKLMQFITSNINFLILRDFVYDRNFESRFEKLINYHCLYDNRGDRLNFSNKFQILS